MSNSSVHEEWLADVQPVPRNVGGRPATNRSNRLRKLECPSCGFICRASAGAIRNVGAPTCACGSSMIVPELRDMAAVDPDAPEVLSADGLQRERQARADIRRLEREAASGFKVAPTNCAVCGCFKARPADVCGRCGDEPATFGATDAEVREARRVHNTGAGYAA